MSLIINQINETLDYLQKYQAPIAEEGCSKEFSQIVNSLENFKLTQAIVSTERFPTASNILFFDRFIRILDSMVLPESAKTANRVFKIAVLKDLEKCSGITELKEFPGPHSLIDTMQNAQNYESLAANSYDPKSIVNNLLCALECLRIKETSQKGSNAFVLSEIQRIENLLSALTDPIGLGYAIRYLFIGFENHQVTFSIHHPRFIEILNDLRKAMNATPSEDVMAASIMRWVDTLKTESAAQRDVLSEMPTEILSVIGSFLPVKDLKNLGGISKLFNILEYSTQITQLWEKIAKDLERDTIGRSQHPKQKVKSYFTYIWEKKILTAGNPPDAKENAFVMSMIEANNVTTRVLSGILRRSGSSPLAFKAVDLAKVLTGEHLTDALDLKLPKEIFEAILKKMSNVPKSALVGAIQHGNSEILSLFLKKTAMSPQWTFNKSLELSKFKIACFLLTIYPDIVVSSTDLVNITRLINPNAEYFEKFLQHYLKNKDNVVSFKTVQKIDCILSNQFRPHIPDTEDIIELIAKAYINTNKINSLELLSDNFEVKTFILGKENKTMTAKLIQAVHDLKKSEEQ